MRLGVYFDTTQWGLRWRTAWKFEGHHYANEWGIGPLSFVRYMPHVTAIRKED